METEQYPIVGVAAPFGDIEALTALLTHIPLNVGIGMIIVRQKETTQDGPLAAALSRHTPMPVEVAADGAAVKRNHIYIANAMKYGALSHAQDNIEVTWSASLGDTNLRIEWRESSPKEITAPTKKGFGTELIERELHHVLETQTEFSFLPKGLEVVITIPVRPDRLRIQSQGETA